MSAQIDVATRGLHRSTRVPLTARLRSGGIWIVAAVVVLIAVIATMMLSSDPESAEPLHYDSTERDGIKALVETLRERGVEVTTTSDIDTATVAAQTPGSSLLIPANAQYLTKNNANKLLSGLEAGGNRLILADPGPAIETFTSRIVVNDELSALSSPEAVTPPDCSSPVAAAAGEVLTGETEYAEAKANTPGLSTCYPFSGPGTNSTGSGKAHGQLIVDEGSPVPTTVLGNTRWLTNSDIDEEGNASLALSVLGASPSLVIYHPDPAGSADSPPSTIDFIPKWFILGVLWLFPCLIVGILVVSRRFGPLAVERLPAIVPSVETVRSRAALSIRSRDRSGTLHTLRTASLLRIARTLALSPSSRTPDIVTAIAERTGRNHRDVEAVFVTAAPRTDQELVSITAQITLIESEITTS